MVQSIEKNAYKVGFSWETPGPGSSSGLIAEGENRQKKKKQMRRADGMQPCKHTRRKPRGLMLALVFTLWSAVGPWAGGNET